MSSILETVQDCLMSWGERVWNHLTNISYKTRTLFTLSTELFLCKTIKCSQSSVAQKAHVIRLCATLFDMIQSLLSPSSIIKHVVISQEYFKKYKVQSWKKSWFIFREVMTAQSLFSLMLRKALNVFM